MTKSTSEQTAARRICVFQELAWWNVSSKKGLTQRVGFLLYDFAELSMFWGFFFAKTGENA